MSRSVILVIGTRPEGVKMIPLYYALKQANVPVILCSTAQHDELLDEVYKLFGVVPDISLNIMRPSQDLFYLTQAVLERTKEVFTDFNPVLVFVQGDTTSSMASALAAFYLKIPVAHVEAGLRTHDIYNPYPEEANRKIISALATYHFAPTPHAASYLLQESLSPDHVFCVGNTVVDALRIMRSKIENGEIVVDSTLRDTIETAKKKKQKIVLLTCHRRESFDGGIVSILEAIKQYALEHSDVLFFYPVHPNPRVLSAVQKVGLESVSTIALSKPLVYKDLIYVLLQADVVATDSGGVYEEAISLAKRVLVLREKTERPEGIWAGYAQLVGTHGPSIKRALQQALTQAMLPQTANRIYGDGYAAQKIAAVIQKRINQESIIMSYAPLEQSSSLI